MSAELPIVLQSERRPDVALGMAYASYLLKGRAHFRHSRKFQVLR